MTITAIRPVAVAGGHTPAAPSPAIDFDDLLRNHRKQLLAAAYWRTGADWHEAEDAVQDALIYAWLNQDKFDPSGPPAVAWVTSLTKYSAHRLFAVKAKYIPSEWVEDAAEQVEDRATDTGLPGSADPEVAAGSYVALLPLPDRHRQAVQMYCLQGMDRRDIAKCMGLRTSEVVALIRSGLRMLDRRTAPQVKAPVPMRTEVENLGALFDENPDLVAKLSARQREAIRLRFDEGLSQTAAGVRMGLPSTAVKRYLVAAAEHVRDALEGRPRRSRIPEKPNLDALLADRHFLATLTAEQAEVVRLRLVERLTGPKTAAALGLTEARVWTVQRQVVELWIEWREPRSEVVVS